MTYLDTQPNNFNILRTNKFSLSFSRIPNMTYFCQTVTLPSLFVGGPILSGNLSDLQLPGDKLQTDAIQVTFLISEDLAGYKELYNWIVGISFPDDFSQFRDLKAGDGEDSDAEIIVMSNNENPLHKFQFEHVHIQTLGPIDFGTNIGEEPLICTASFSYQIPFKIETF